MNLSSVLANSDFVSKLERVTMRNSTKVTEEFLLARQLNKPPKANKYISIDIYFQYARTAVLLTET